MKQYTSLLCKQLFVLTLLTLLSYSLLAQCNQNYNWAMWTNFTGKSATGTIQFNGEPISVNMTSNFEFNATSFVWDYWKFNDFKGGIPNTTVPATTWLIGPGGSTTMCFSKEVENPVLVLASLGAPGRRVDLSFSEPYVPVYDGGGMTFVNDSTVEGEEGYAVILFPGKFTCVTIHSHIYEYYTNITWGLNPPLFPVSITGNTTGCDSVVLTASGGVSYEWSGGKYPHSATNTFTESGNYSVVVTDNNGCTVTALKTVTVNTSRQTTINKTICKGASYLGYTASGIYKDVFKRVGSCDSIRILNLTVKTCLVNTCDQAKILEKDTTVCSGSPLTFHVNAPNSADKCGTYLLSEDLKNGLLGWYPFCSSTADISGQGNNGMATGTLTYSADRYNHPGTAIRFSGNGESVRTNKIDRTTTNSFTYVVWVKTDNTVVLPSQTTHPQSGFSIDLSTPSVIHASHGFNWNGNNQHTGAGLYVAKNGIFVLEHADVIVPTPLVWTGNLEGWHSVALVYDHHVPKLYIDGTFIKEGLTTPYTVHPSMGCDSFFFNNTYPYLSSGFGKGFKSSNVSIPFNNFKGEIDDIKIYNRALDADELRVLFAKDKTSIRWSTGDTTASISVKPTRSTSYVVTVSNSLGTCQDTVNVNVTPKTVPAITIKSDTTNICPGTTVIFTATPVNGGSSLTFQWKKNNNTVGENKSTYSDSSLQDQDTITCTLISNDVCATATPAVSNPIIITVSAGQQPVDLGRDIAVCAGSYILNARSGFQSYLWQDASTDSVFKVSRSGTYAVEVTDRCGHLSRSSVVITLGAIAAIDLGADLTKCSYDTVVINGPSGFSTYRWSPGTDASGTHQQNLAVYTPTSAVYKLQVQNTLGCTAVDSVKVTVAVVPALTLRSDTTICEGDSLKLSATPVFQSYEWSSGDTTSGIVVKQPGLYHIEAKASNGCYAQASFTLYPFYPRPNPELGTDSFICLNDSKVLDAGHGYASYVWSTGSTAPQITVTGLGYYSVTVTDGHGCSGSDTTVITTALPLPANFLPPDTAVCRYGSVQLKPLQSFSAYQWSTGVNLPEVSIREAGTYWLQVRDPYGCTGRDSIVIQPRTCQEGLYVPNAFTPNGDGKNDGFKPIILGVVEQYAFTVYNRWGEKVFETSDPLKGWDGVYRGKQNGSNVFVWTCRYLLTGQAQRYEKGTVVLIK
jgi:gliding motility-associated-like protein